MSDLPLSSLPELEGIFSCLGKKQHPSVVNSYKRTLPGRRPRKGYPSHPCRPVRGKSFSTSSKSKRLASDRMYETPPPFKNHM